MKLPRVVFVVWVLGVNLQAEEPAAPAPVDPNSPAAIVDPSADGTSSAPAAGMTTESPRRTFIPGSFEVTPFTPPVPVVRKPPPVIRIDASVTRRGKNGTNLTLQRGEASTQPDCCGLN